MTDIEDYVHVKEAVEEAGLDLEKVMRLVRKGGMRGLYAPDACGWWVRKTDFNTYRRRQERRRSA